MAESRSFVTVTLALLATLAGLVVGTLIAMVMMVLAWVMS